MPTIEDVKRFWNENPLWTGEAQAAPGSEAFFESHSKAVLDMDGGRIDPRYLPACAVDAPILDLGCGIGFWPIWFAENGFRNITAADLSERSLELAALRARMNGHPVRFELQNAEAMTFSDGAFAHVNCSGVIHHSPSPAASMREIYRVLAPGGRAVVGVYYLNILHRMWPMVRSLARLASRAGLVLRGRGREGMLSASSASELVRLYDGVDNPIGTGFSKSGLLGLVPAEARAVSVFYGVFPARVMPRWMPGWVADFARWLAPLMIMVSFEKPAEGARVSVLSQGR
jgi:SAM-dependent methyltransferase